MAIVGNIAASLKSGDWKWTTLSRWLPHRQLFHNGIIRSKGNALTALIEYHGPNLPVDENTDLAVLVGSIASQVGDFGRENAWTINAMCHVFPYAGYLQPERHIGDPVYVKRVGGAPGYLDAVRAERFEGRLFSCRTYIALTYRPGGDAASKLEKAFTSSVVHKSDMWKKHLSKFEDRVKRAASAIHEIMSSYKGWARICSAEEVRSAMIFEIEGRHGVYAYDSRKRFMHTHKLWDKRLRWGQQVTLDGLPFRHVRTVGIIDHPEMHFPEMMARLRGLGFPFKISQRCRIFDKNVLKGTYRKTMKEYDDAKLSIFGHMKAMLSKGGKASVKPDAMADAEADLAEVDIRSQARAKCGGHLTTSLVTWGDTHEEANERAEALFIALESLGFYPTIEHANSFFAYLGSFPGEIDRNTRGDMFPEQFFAMRIPLTAPWTGDNSSPGLWGGPCLFQAVTCGSVPFRFDNFDNAGGGGAVAMWGRNGSGKSTLARIIAAHWLARHANGIVIDFDVQSEKSASRVAAMACGGSVIAVNNTRLQPLRDIDDADIKQQAISIIRSMLDVQGFHYTADAGEAIVKAIDLMIDLPKEHRTMSMFRAQCEDRAVKAAVTDYCDGGAYGYLMDGQADPFSLSSWTVIDLSLLISENTVKPQTLPILSTVLYRVNRLMDGETPSMMIVDEPRLAATALGHIQFIEWLAQNRKRRCVTWMCWHNSDEEMQASGLEEALRTQCDVQMFAAGGHVAESGTRAWMSRFGVTDLHAEEMKHASPHDWLVMKDKKAQLISPAIGKEELALFGINSKEATKAAEALYQAVGPDVFWVKWLERMGINDAQDVLGRWLHDGNPWYAGGGNGTDINAIWNDSERWGSDKRNLRRWEAGNRDNAADTVCVG